jgi:hypothetical protein
MECENCVFKLTDTNHTFQCKFCNKLHECGVNVCDHTIFNTDHTKICTITGLCFNQRLCDTNIDTNRGVSNIVDIDYQHKIKRNQQVKNSSMKRSYVRKLFEKLDYFNEFEQKTKVRLINSVTKLWLEFIVAAENKGIYIHRKDKRCFVVAIMFGITTGISSSSGFVVNPHENIKINKLNKKRDYNSFKVSDIRAGQKLIKFVFENNEITNSIKL